VPYDSDAGGPSTRALVLQVEPVHEEVVNSLREVLLRNGVSSTMLLDQGIRARGDLFGTFTDYGDDVHYASRDDRWETAAALANEADLVVFNTFQLNGHARRARQLGKPTLGVVHNPRLFVSNPDCVEFARSGQLQLVTLAPHATSDLISHDPVLYADTATIGAWMFDIPEALRKDSPSRTRITIPGGVDFRNRDYRALLARLPDLVAEFGTDHVEIAVVGGGQDNGALRELVRERGLEDVFNFCPVDPATGMVRSEVLYPELARSTFLLPMLPESRHDYRRWKISAAISSSIGFSVPAILDRWTATVYDLPGVSYRAGRYVDGIARALALPGDEVDRMRTGLDTARAHLRERSAEEMGQALANLGARGADAPVPPTVDSDDREAFLDFARRLLPTSYAQRFQDAWALWESGFSRDGYFVDFGAVNGVSFSNSYLLERLGWNGIAAEPHPDHAEALRRNRTCTVSTKCVLDTTGDTVTFRAVRGRPALSTVAGFGETDAHAAHREDYVEHQVDTVTLTDLLDETDAPAEIDFLSIDTEGSEPQILRAHDFDRFRIRCIAVEHNDHQREELYELLTAEGYRRKWPELSGHDDWYVLDGAYPAWSPGRLEEVLADAARIEPFEGGYDDRCRQMLDFVGRDVELPPLRKPVSSVPGDTGSSTFLEHLLAEVETRADVPPRVQGREFRRLFRALSRVSGAARLLVVTEGPPPELAGVAPDGRITWTPEQVSAARLAKALPGSDPLVAWVDCADTRRVLLDAGALQERARVVAVTVAREPEPGVWGSHAVTDHLVGRGLVPVARATQGDDRVSLMFADHTQVRHRRVARQVVRSMLVAPTGDRAEDTQPTPRPRMTGLRGVAGRARSLLGRVAARLR
jgi:FkbM family methyltransferase